MRKDKRLLGEINITNLVDVTLVLLIVFILLAPMIESGIDLNLPLASNTRMDVDEEHIVLSITGRGEIYWDNERLGYEQFRLRVEDLVSSRGNPSFLIRGDENASYGQMIKVLDLLRSNGVQQLDLATRTE